MKIARETRRILCILLSLCMALSCIGATAFAEGTACVDCSGTYENGICNSDGSHYEAAPHTEGVYQISNAGQLYWFAALVNNGANEYGASNGQVLNAVLTNDIVINANLISSLSIDDNGVAADSTTAREWTPIGLYTDGRTYVRYSGTFDGAGHAISGLYYYNDTYKGTTVGLFGALDTDGIVKNVRLVDSYILGQTNIGGIAGANYGGTIEKCGNAATIHSNGRTGGIVGSNSCVGYNSGLVIGCDNTGAITTSSNSIGGIVGVNENIDCKVEDCTNSGAISGASSIGGIVGTNGGVITDCHNTGAVSGTSWNVGGVVGNANECGPIFNCSNSGAVTGTSNYTGGIAGNATEAAITSCYNTGAVSGAKEWVGGVAGKLAGNTTGNASIVHSYNTGVISGTKELVGGVAGQIDADSTTNFTAKVEDSYSSGTVSGSSKVGGVAGALGNTTHCSIVGSYYLSDTDNDGLDGTTAKAEAAFLSGEVAYLMNGSTSEGNLVWYQTINVDKSPKFSGQIVYYDADAVPQYYNSDPHTHTFDQQVVDEEFLAKEATCVAAATYYYSCVCREKGTETFTYGEPGGHIYNNGFCTGVSTDYEPATLNSQGVYEISNGGQLYWFAEFVNGNTLIAGADTADDTTDDVYSASANAVLTADITINQNVLVNGALNTDADVVGAFRTWTPIGTSSVQYTGTFDGNNKTISGLYFNDTTTTTGRWIGLIGYLYEGGEIKNVTVENSYFNANQSVGAVVGATSKSSVINCHSSAVVIGTSSVGGVVGHNQYGLVENCTNSGSVSGTGNVGGVVGNNSGTTGSYVSTVKNCTNTGAVNGIADNIGTEVKLGGIVGYNNGGTVESCTNSGSIVNVGSYTGGVIGTSKEGTVTDCSNSGSIEGKSYTGGVIGQASGTVTNCHNTADVVGLGYLGGVIGKATYVGTTSKTYAGSTITNCSNTGNVTSTSATSTYIGGVFGIVSGQNTSSTKLTKVTDCFNTGDVVGNSKVGGVSGEVNYVKMTDSYNTGEVKSQILEGAGTTAGRYVGGLIGCVQKGCTITKCYNTGDVISAESYVGGLVGNCNTAATISLCYNTGDVSGTDWIGGLIGSAQGTVKNCYTSGTVAASENAAYAGDVAGKNTATYTNCYYLAESETDALDGTTFKTAAQFASGEVAYLLNSSTSEGDLAWYQNIDAEGVTADASPVLTSTHGIVYAGYTSCGDTAAVYTNDSTISSEKPAHTYVKMQASSQVAQAATCVEAATYYVKCDNCDAVSETLTVSDGEPNGHTYGDPEFVWTDLAAEATFTCSACEDGTEGHTVTETAAVEQTGSTAGDCQTASTTTYTATVVLAGQTYTEDKTVQGEFGAHKGDGSGDHKCDLCGDELSECADANKDHKCDVCEKVLSECADSNGDYKCDTCGADLGTAPNPECPKDETCVLAQFSDIDPDSCWYHDGVHYCVETGLMKGQGNNSFAPDAFTTRAELVMILYREAGSPSLDGLTEPFTDVADDAWYYEAIVWAYNNGVVNGTSATTFAPDANVTRQDVATILHRYLESPDGTGDLSVFPDAANIWDHAKDALVWAVGEGLINGVEQKDAPSLLDPTGNATRAQIATILYRYLTAE